MNKQIFPPLKTLLVFFLLMASSFAAMADEQTAYIHALKNLRAARWFIATRPGGGDMTDQEVAAMHEIELAVAAIIKCDIDDGKYYKDIPEVDGLTIPDREGRLQRAIDLLKKATADLDLDATGAYAGGLKVRVLTHVKEAIKQTQKALDNKATVGYLK